MTSFQVKDGDGNIRTVEIPPLTGDSVPPSEAQAVVLRSCVYAEDTPHTTGEQGLLMLAVRSDTDAPTANNGDYTVLKLDEVGRLKVASQPAGYPLITGDISSLGGVLAAKVDRTSNVMIHMVASVLVGHAAVFEGSLNSTDGTDGAWFTVQAVRSNANTVETATGTLTATPTYGWELSVNGLAWVRVRATAHTSGVATYLIQRATYATEPIPAAQASATQPVTGATAEDSANTQSPVIVGGIVRTALGPATLVAGDGARATMTSGAALVVQAGAVPEARWQATGDMSTTADLVIAAATASYRNYVTDFSYQNTGATATFVVIKDASAVVWKGFAPANMPVPAVISLCSPLRAAAVNTAFNAACLTAGAAVSFNACGYKAL
ncbi:hypothetical protein [Ideonella paludis]|uniref:Phage tail protein n=1 Tax=Ideonella paludis TaxID=1233411 RepID=A0ABS5DU21_9BURK|nr:hypothetical protein [Ideonella paludis]MBQ0934643.1 hypothetical protein [Ideonella paludis]